MTLFPCSEGVTVSGDLCSTCPLTKLLCYFFIIVFYNRHLEQIERTKLDSELARGEGDEDVFLCKRWPQGFFQPRKTRTDDFPGWLGLRQLFFEGPNQYEFDFEGPDQYEN